MSLYSNNDESAYKEVEDRLREKHAAGKWVETGEPGGNSRKHGETHTNCNPETLEL